MINLTPEAEKVHKALLSHGLETPFAIPKSTFSDEKRKQLISAHITEVLQLLVGTERV